jgi:hypothetical protein
VEVVGLFLLERGARRESCCRTMELLMVDMTHCMRNTWGCMNRIYLHSGFSN